MKLKSIGTVQADEKGLLLKIDEAYKACLIGLEGFSHVQVIWWANQLDDEHVRTTCTVEKPYKPGPDVLGIFATRSPMRPNPICTTVISVADLHIDSGEIRTWYIDADVDTPVIDIKPYLPCSDKPENVQVPKWSAMLPDSIEASADFDWESYFNF